jgi:hypothetical protein
MLSHQVSSFFITAVLAISLFAVSRFAYASPFWLREGTYAYYYVDFNPLHFENDTLIWRGNGTYGWKCLGVTGNVAVLEVLVNITGRRIDPDMEKTVPYASITNYTISINVETREASYGDEYLGFLPYWVPAAIEELPYMDEDQLPDWIPKDIQWRFIENFASYDNVTTYGIVAGGCEIETPYKTFKGDQVISIVGAFGPTQGFDYRYEKDSGLLIETGMGSENFLRKVIKTKKAFDNLLLLDTNIHSLPEPTSPLNVLLPYIITATTLSATTTSIYLLKIRKKPQPKK